MSFENYCDICFESSKEGCFSMSKSICRKHYNMNKEKIQSLEQEVARLKEESLKFRNCHNCKFPMFDYGEMDCHKKDNSFYDKYDLLYCDKWEIKK